jgi:hypothetical protein
MNFYVRMRLARSKDQHFMKGSSIECCSTKFISVGVLTQTPDKASKEEHRRPTVYDLPDTVTLCH